MAEKRHPFAQIREEIEGKMDQYHSYPHGTILEYHNLHPKTWQKFELWFRKDLYRMQTHRIRPTYNPTLNSLQLKFSHQSGEALVKAFQSIVAQWNSSVFAKISPISKFISNTLEYKINEPTPPHHPHHPHLLTPSLTILTKPHSLPLKFPSIILDYTYSPSSTPESLTASWLNLYRLRDLYFSASKDRTIILLAVFHTDPESKRVHGRLDVWRYDSIAKRARLSNSVQLFPVDEEGLESILLASQMPASNSNDLEEEDGEMGSFSLQEIFGRDCSFKFKESKIPEDMKFVPNVRQIRWHMTRWADGRDVNWDVLPNGVDLGI